MFRKPFKLKLQMQLKSTEKKKFGTDLKTIFPALRDEDIASLTGGKVSIVRTKITTFKEEDVEVYCVNKVPMYIDILDTDIKLPSVFMIWKFPHMLPTYTTTTSVLNKLKNGADLFFPGIYTEGLFFCELEYKKNSPVCVNLVDNKAAVGVGISLVDRDDVMDGNKHKALGKIVKIYHTVGDFLFKMNPDAAVLQLGPPDWALPVSEEPQPGPSSMESSNPPEDMSNLAGQVEGLEIEKEPEEETNVELERERQNEVLEYCFLKALKNTPKSSYPILPATFYANYVLTGVPEGQSLNVKKTKWKKFSAFLQDKSLEGLVQLQKTTKNEFSISGTNLGHTRLKNFVDPYQTQSVVVEPKADNKPVVQQVYSVTTSTLSFFGRFGLKKHDELTRQDVKNHLNDYIKEESLVHPDNPELVVLDPILYNILKGDEVISRANLFTGMLEKMNVQHKVSNCGNGDAILHKGKMPMIEFETCIRTGNKKVTLISNLECYGVNASNFSKELQHKAAASTSITPFVAGKKGPQVQVQGNQIAIAVNMLKEKYNINEKFMRGHEKAVKSKKK